MTKIQLSSIEVLHFKDEAANEEYHGFNQEWYGKKWRRMAGCGPTTAAQIIYYIQSTRNIMGEPFLWKTREDCLPFMDTMWNYVTPTMQGVNKPEILADGVVSYGRTHGVQLHPHTMVVGKQITQRPQLAELASFLITSLQYDLPVAFLNWHQGDCPEVDSWHWVCLIGADWEESQGTLDVEILDEGKIKRVALHKWLLTTKLGGAFVSSTLSE